MTTTFTQVTALFEHIQYSSTPVSCYFNIVYCVFQLCYKGVPLCYRATIWNLLSGNFLQITPELYAIFKERSVNISSKSHLRQASAEEGVEAASSSMVGAEVDLEAGGYMHGKEESMAIIRHDVPRTFAEIEVS
jgi:hypothetical protein